MSEISNQFWDQRASKYDAAISRHDAQYDARLAHLKSQVRPTDEVLDFGCASGEIAADLSPHVKSIEGIDPSTAMIELAGRKAAIRGIKNAGFLATDIFDARLEAESYDAVLALNVLHLVKDHAAVLPRLRQILRPGGVLLVETPCLAEMCWWQKWPIFAASKLRLVPQVHAYKKGEPEAELTRHGFEINSAQLEPKHNFCVTLVAQKPEEKRS